MSLAMTLREFGHISPLKRIGTLTESWWQSVAVNGEMRLGKPLQCLTSKAKGRRWLHLTVKAYAESVVLVVLGHLRKMTGD